MSFTKFMGKCGASVASAWNGVERTAHNTKQEGKIADAESRIATLTAEIGNLSVMALDEGAKAGEQITERYNAILEARKEIEAAAANKRVKKATCPHCGKRTASGMRYCGYCGKEL